MAEPFAGAWRHLGVLAAAGAGEGFGAWRWPRYPGGPCRVASPRASMRQCADAPPVVIVIRRPETVKRAGVRSTRSARRRRLQPVPVTRSSTARYRDLIDHPRHDNDYRVEATAGSLLVPTLAVWAAVTADATTLGMLADFVAGPYAHSTLQLWYPGFDTETHLYRGSGAHGLAATGIDIQRSCEAMLSPIKSECEASEAFASLSAVRAGLWPLVILASRHHRVPVPPQFWRPGESINE